MQASGLAAGSRGQQVGVMLSAAPALRGTQPDTTAAVSPQQDLANNAST